ncbi:MAG: hypothetical protein JSW63_00465 [Ignavibacterium sp.]|nr:MAG: hypothetical protein JSW63_00465 [Ignavibacterium sp.]
MLKLFFSSYLIILLTTPLFPQKGTDSVTIPIQEYEPSDRFGLWLGYFGPSFEASVRVNSRTLGLGSYVRLENAFELPTTQNVFRVEAYFRITKHHKIRAGYYGLSRDGSSVLERELRIGDNVYPVGSVAIAEEKFDIFKLIYAYSIVNNEEIESGVSAGISIIRYFLDSKREVLGFENKTEVDVTLPVPVLGLHTIYHLWKRFDALFYVNFFSVKIDIYDGLLFDAGLGIQYFLIDQVALGLGFNIFKLDVFVDDPGEFQGRINYFHQGIAFYALFTF